MLEKHYQQKLKIRDAWVDWGMNDARQCLIADLREHAAVTKDKQAARLMKRAADDH
jgi:hypothetical protein